MKKYLEEARRGFFADWVSTNSLPLPTIIDVPRCHQYNQLMFSPQGHEKMRRLLKCWVEANEHQVYWQGKPAGYRGPHLKAYDCRIY